MVKKILFVILVIVIGGVSGIIANRYLFPYLATTKIFQKNDWLKKGTEDVTIINRTEQVYVKEDTSINQIGSQVVSSVVDVISYVDNKNSLQKQATTSIKEGTGIIVTSDGVIMTYASNILPENAKYKIVTNNGTSYDAALWGIDSYSNLAFFKIEASNLPVVSFGDSSQIKAGEKIIAIGTSQSNYQNKFNTGVVSDFDETFNLSGKAISEASKLEGVFEINPLWGDNVVGGPIVDYSGAVIGVVGSIESDGKNSLFAIPSDKIRIVLDKAISKKFDQNSELGVYYLSITSSYALVNNLKVDKGAMVYSPSGQQGLAVISGSPADKAGIKINDVITAVDGEEVNLDSPLPNRLYQYNKGDQVELTILRDGQEMKVKVQL